MTAVPRRAYRLVLDLEADSWDELVSTVDRIGLELVQQPQREGTEITSGGYASGYHMEISHRAGQTGDRYRHELMQWCDERRAARRAREGESV